MDLIAALSSQLDIPSTQAQAVAGTVMGTVKGQLAEQVDSETAQKFEQQVPEMGAWQQQAEQAVGGGQAEQSGGLGGLGGLLGGAAGALGGAQQGGGLGGLLGGAASSGLLGKEAKDLAAVTLVLSKFNIDASKAALVAPLVLQFLKSKLDPGMLSKVLTVAPMLAALKGGGAAPQQAAAPSADGGLGGMLGGLGKLMG